MKKYRILKMQISSSDMTKTENFSKGFEANDKWAADSARHKAGVSNGEIDQADFGKWYNFANCMKNALNILEGQAYMPEIMLTKTKVGTGYASVPHYDQKPFTDDGSEEGEEQTDDTIMAGLAVGSSKIAIDRTKELFRKVKDSSEPLNTRFHGGGSRFIENKDGSDSLISRCAKFLPAGAADPLDINVIFTKSYFIFSQ